MRIRLPFIDIYFNIERNTRFYANIQWILYKYFKKTREYSCGQKYADKCLYCAQPWKKERLYLSEDKHKIKCRVCNKTRISANYELTLDRLNQPEFSLL